MIAREIPGRPSSHPNTMNPDAHPDNLPPKSNLGFWLKLLGASTLVGLVLLIGRAVLRDRPTFTANPSPADSSRDRGSFRVITPTPAPAPAPDADRPAFSAPAPDTVTAIPSPPPPRLARPSQGFQAPARSPGAAAPSPAVGAAPAQSPPASTPAPAESAEAAFDLRELNALLASVVRAPASPAAAIADGLATSPPEMAMLPPVFSELPAIPPPQNLPFEPEPSESEIVPNAAAPVEPATPPEPSPPPATATVPPAVPLEPAPAAPAVPTVPAAPPRPEAVDPATDPDPAIAPPPATAVRPGTLPDISALIPDDAAEAETTEAEDVAVRIPPPRTDLPNQVFVEQFSVVGSTVFAASELARAARDAVLADDIASTQTAPSDIDATTADAASASASRGGDESAAESEDTATIAATDLLVNRSLAPSELIRASDAITQRYVEAGYINSGAYVPQDSLNDEDGEIEIRVVEGSIESINVEVSQSDAFLNFPLNPGYVRDRLRLASGTPFNVNRLVEGVQMLELDPLIEQISTEVAPGTETGTSILNVSVDQADTFAATLSTDNNRSPSVGSFRQQLQLSQANLLGRGDRLSLSYARTSGSNEWSLGYALPLNARNGTLSFNTSFNDNRIIEEPFSALDIISSSQAYELSFRQPLVQTPTNEFALRLTASRQSIQSEFLGGIPLVSTGSDEEGRTNISALRFGQEWISRGQNRVLALLSEFSLGLDVLGATINESGPDSRFFVWRGQGQLAQRIGSDALLLVRGNVQIADRPLVPTERFGVGGQDTVRGYRLNTLLTDSGWLASAELQVPVLRMPEMGATLQLAPFIDIGGGWNLNNQPNLGADELPSTLVSTGLGLIWQVDDILSARLDWGIPLTSIEREGSSLQESGIHFSLRFSPF